MTEQAKTSQTSPHGTRLAEGHCTIRALHPDDFDSVALLAGQLGYPSSAGQVRLRAEGMASAECGVFVAELPTRQIAGWIAVYIFRSIELDPCTVISGLVVDEACRYRGIGKMLLCAAEEWARQQGCELISVSSNVTRKRAHRFYTSLGYSRVKAQVMFSKTLG